MATNLDQPPRPDVANSLLFGDELNARERVDGETRAGSIWLVLGPIVFVLALLVLATAYSGAFNVRQWAPPTLFVLFMLLTLVLRGGGARLPDRWVALALAGAWGLAIWAALSATWAASADEALQGAGRQAMYAAILTLPFVAVGDLRALRVAARGVVAGIALIAVYTLLRTLLDGSSMFLAGRLNDPVGYRNATALLFCIGYWPLVVSAAARGRGRALRAGCFALAELMLGLAFLTQSRGVVLGLGCGALVALALGPDRVRRAWLALLSFVLLAGAAPWLLRPYHAFTAPGRFVADYDIAVAGWALLALVGVSLTVGFLLAVFDTGLRPASPAMSRVRAAARIGLLAALIGVLAGGLVAVHGDPGHELQAKWSQFKSLELTSTSATRYSSTGGQRYDLWRVALNELRAHPLGGVGEGSYSFSYYRLRHTNRNLDDPHGLLFQLGAEQGVVGLLLLTAMLVGLAGSLRRWWRAAPLQVRRSVCGLSAAGATFLGQSLVDWMWRIPGLTALGLMCLAVAAALLARSAAEGGASVQGRTTSVSPRALRRAFGHGRPAASARVGVAGRIVLAAPLLAAAALILSLYLSDAYIRSARAQIGRSPTAQLAAARTAAGLDPWAVDAHFLQASALETLGRRAQARRQLQDARRLEPANQVPLGLLGDFEARGGDFAAARAYYARALALDPLDVGLRQLALSGGKPSGS
ncbi:MAG TPA: O-antigen ligase family protein [Solirubrobacteraceae bacterium]|nr:O-antigen ligase family protein [Solirubrobacteraceae bacterium]